MSDAVDTTSTSIVVRVANVQCNVVYGDPHANAKSAVAKLEQLAQRGVYETATFATRHPEIYGHVVLP